MKIGYFVGKFPYLNDIPGYRYGGGEVVAYNLAINMAKRGHNVHVFTTSANHREFIENREGLIIHRYRTIVKMIQRNISLGLVFKPLKELLDIVHVHVGCTPFELIGSLQYAKINKKPLIVTYHGDVVPSYDGLMYKSSVQIYNIATKKVLEYADTIVTPSRYYINESLFLEDYKYKIVEIPNGINLRDFEVPYSKEECRRKLGLSVDKRIILFLGVLHPKKGPDILLKAMPSVISEIPDSELVIVGDGVMRRELEELSRKYEVKGHVKFVGFVDENLKPLYYKAADVFCLPSIITSESFGIVNLEAMACGVPVVASKIGGIPDVVKNGKTGLLVPPRDPKALAEAIICLLQDENVRRKMGRNARKKAENYSWKRIAEKYERVYEELISGGYDHRGIPRRI